MNADIQGKLDLIKAPALAQIEAADAIPALVDAEVKAFGESEYLRGQASIVLPEPGTGELIYSQEDADKLAEVVRGENDEEVAKLTAVVSEKDAKIVELESALVSKDAEKEQALKDLSVEIGGMIEKVEIDNLELAATLKAKGSPVAFR